MSVTHSVADPHIERFLDRLERIKGSDHSTYQLYRRCLELYDENLDGTDAVEAGTLDVEDHILTLKEEGYAGNSIKSHFIALQKFYTTAETRFEVIEDHPCEAIDLDDLNVFDRRDDDQVYYVSEEEKERMIEAVADGPNYVRDRLIIETFWQTGVRKNELRNILLENVDQDGRQIRVFGEKTNQWRTVHYQPSLNKLLDLWTETERPLRWDSEYLFPSVKAKQIAKSTIRDVIRKAASVFNEIVGETQDGRPQWRVTTHSMRHGHAVHALKSGVDIRSVQLQLGHENIETTMQYLPLLDDDVAEAYRAFE